MTREQRPGRSDLVVLMGLMASGKSAVGGLLAERTGRRLVDVDEVIHDRTGFTTRELWERDGEAGYRQLERDVSVEVLTEAGSVVLGLPGGAIDEQQVQQALAAADPFTVWLRARPATLAERVGSSDHRPLVGGDPLALLERQQRERGPRFGAVAQLVVDVDDVDAEHVADRIVTALGER